MQYTEEQITRANQTNLVSFLNAQGEQLVKSGREYRWKKHDSVTVSGNRWYRHSQGRGGYPVDFVMEFYNATFSEAVKKLIGEEGEGRNSTCPAPSPDFRLPEKEENNEKIIRYLTENRGIEKNLVEEWISSGDIYEAIIPQDVFDLVQAKMKGRKRQTEQGEYSMFAGLLRCAECGGALTLKKTHTKDQHEVYTCSTYIHKGKAHCTQHRVDADDLYDAVLIRIQECAKAVTGDGTELENRVKELCEEDTQGHRDSLEKLVSKQKDRLETLDRLIAKLYDDLINDKITESVFDKMLEKTQKEQADIKKELSQNESVLNTEEKLDAQSQQWIEDISEYADIKELDANLLNRLISKIVISEPQEKDGKENYRRTTETVTMEIHFNLKPIPELGTIERGSGSHK